MSTKTNGRSTAATIRVAEPTAASPSSDEPVEITIQRIERAVVNVPVIGVTPLIMHNWSEKSKRKMLDAQIEGKTSTKRKREPRDPQADYEAAFYRLEDGRPGMPAAGFKASIADAARFYEGVTIVSLKTALFVHGVGRTQLVPIEGEVAMREDTPRNASGVSDLRYRPEFWPWSALLVVEYLPTMLSAESVFNLVDAGGRNGVGDWRPSSPKSKTGTYGQYRVTS